MRSPSFAFGAAVSALNNDNAPAIDDAPPFHLGSRRSGLDLSKARFEVDMLSTTSGGSPITESQDEGPLVGDTEGYEELLVLVHGLHGQGEDFNYLIKTFSEANASSSSRIALHVTRANTNLTHDGIDRGGERLAKDIKKSVAEHGHSLKRISLVGFSLGGLYVRYAIGLLLDEQSRIAGLKPNKLILVASPNLGSRIFGFVRYIPPPVHVLANILIGPTGKHLMLLDSERLVMEMTTDDNQKNLPFIRALKAFRDRLIYANTRNDALVPYGTASLNPDNRSTSMRPLSLPRGAVEVDEHPDDYGSKVWFTYEYPQSDLHFIDEKDDASQEEVMAKRLRSVGWKVTGVDFAMPLPLAHNRVVAMSRGPIHTWMNAAGRRTVHHLVDNLLGGNGAEPRFNRILVPSKSLSG